MKYRDVLKIVAREAAEHLYSLEIYDEPELEDASTDQVDKAIETLQWRLRRFAEGRQPIDME
jgi:hypothetical protein